MREACPPPCTWALLDVAGQVPVRLALADEGLAAKVCTRQVRAIGSVPAVMKRQSLCRTVAACLLLTSLAASLERSATAQPPQALELEIPAGRFVGLPIHWGSREGILLEANGQFLPFSPRDVRRHQLLDTPFVPQSLAEARAQLAAELGPAYEALIAGPYVLAAPSGTVGRWQQRFTALLAGYQRYFEVRGWSLRQPDFPLCVIVLPDRRTFRQYALQQARNLPDDAVGSYFPRSNRCVLYQIPAGSGTNWSETEATIVHEAIHQLAYNTGVHERLFANPLWFVEGLATMFEMPAVYDTRASRSTLSDRLHPQMLDRLQATLANREQLTADIESLLAHDTLFSGDALRAYALAWAMTFTLVERMPNQYGQFMELQRQRRFAPYAAADRISDFRAAFETSPSMLAHQLQRLLAP